MLIQLLLDRAGRIGKSPTYKQFEDDEDLPDPSIYKRNFGSWNAALQQAGLKVNANRKHSKEMIIKEALEFYAKNGRSPYYYELGYSDTVINRYWNGWKDFLSNINLPLSLQYSEITGKEELKLFLVDLYNELGRVPNTLDVENKGVGRHLFLTKFGGFNNALLESGVVSEGYFRSNEEKLPESKSLIKSYFDEHNEAPTVNAYGELAKQKGLLHRKALEEVMNKRFTEICLEVIGVANEYSKSKEELLSELEILRGNLGRTPMAKELVIHGLAQKRQYYRAFGVTYLQLIEELGWELPVPKRCFKEEEELLEDYQKLYESLGRLPFYDDINKHQGMAHFSTYKKNFGDITNIWEALGLEVDDALLTRSYGKGSVCLDKRGGICRSIPERVITDLLIDMSINFKKEVPYKDCLLNCDKKYKFDWFLTDEQIAIEYFGLFAEKSLEEVGYIGRYSRNVLKKIDLIESDDSKIKFIDLYPEDLDNIEEVLEKRIARLR